MTASQHGALDWIDVAVGPNSSVTAIPYPISSDWFVSQQRWVDFEFFNKSIQRIARVAGSDPFDYVGFWFPKLDLHFDDRTGVVAEHPTRWVVGSEKETRFRIAGPARSDQRGALLIDGGKRWRLVWRTSGLYDDGWTQPGVPVRMRLYASKGQRRPELRTVAFLLRAPETGGSRRIALTVGGKTTRAVVGHDSSVTEFARVCVPTRGYADVRLAVDGASEIPGDLSTQSASLVPRRGGLFIASLSQADEIGRCRLPAGG